MVSFGKIYQVLELPIWVMPLLWALIHYAQNRDAKALSCSDRLVGDTGFKGNSDFYGLGIRLGIYMQWISSLLMNLLLDNEWVSTLVSFIIFSISLLIAVIILAFQNTCTYTVDIIIVLFLYWGGLMCLLYSIFAVAFPETIQISFDGQIGNDDISAWGYRITFFSSWTLSITFSTWFWLRLASVGEVDFSPSPGGTQYFLFCKVGAETRAASIFITLMCLFVGGTHLLSYLFGCFLVLVGDQPLGRRIQESMIVKRKGGGNLLR